MQKLPLSDIRVLDLTQFLSGPYCTQILGDLGAEVIKLESPEGDLARSIPPHFVGDESVYYLTVNRNKKSLCVNLKSEEGRRIALDLIAKSDVVVDNFRPGVLKRLGIDAEAICAEQEALVWCSISGFGQDGPYNQKPAYDMIVQALSGGMSLTGEPDGASVRAGIPLADISAGMYGAISIAAALHRRHATGRGEYIDISMLDCQVAMLSYQAGYYLHSGVVPGHQGSGHDSIPTYRSFRGGDGREIVVTANTERMWQGLCRVLDREDLLEDPRYTTNRARLAHKDQLIEELGRAFQAKATHEWLPLLEAEKIPVGVVNSLDLVMSDPQVTHRSMVVKLESEAGDMLRVVGNPIRLTGTASPAATFPPRLGEHNEDVLSRLIGRTDEEIDRLKANGVVRS